MMLTEKLYPAQKLGERPELEDLSILACPCSASPCIVLQMFQDQVFNERFDGKRGRKASLPFPSFCLPPQHPEGETCPRLLPEVLSPAWGGSLACSSGSGWLQLMSTQREPKPSADVLIWGAPATSAGDTDKQKEAGRCCCFTC